MSPHQITSMSTIIKGNSENLKSQREISLSIGGTVSIWVKKKCVSVGLFDLTVDGEPDSLEDITTEPNAYQRPVYSHDSCMTFKVEAAGNIVSAWFVAFDGELIATGQLSQVMNLNMYDTVELKGPLLDSIPN
jgi:hypothetical protein